MRLQLEEKIEKFATKIAIEWSLLDMISDEDGDENEYGEKSRFPAETEENDEIIKELISLGYLFLDQIDERSGESDEKKFNESRKKVASRILAIYNRIQMEIYENDYFDNNDYKENILNAFNYYEVFIYQEFSDYEQYRKREQS